VKHGDVRGYRNGCRCEPCKGANNEYMKEYRRKRKPVLQEALQLAELIIEGDTSWMKQGVCRGHEIEIFFPKRGDNQAVQAAKNLCSECSVRVECLEYALRTDQEAGIWGGTSGRERREMQSMRLRECA
jgi:hypothetical protein